MIVTVRLRRMVSVGCAALLAACASGVATPELSPPPSAQPVDSALAVATFDSAWKRIADTHFDTAYGGVDWAAVRDELRPAAAAARDNQSLRAVLREMVGRLRESHFGIIPAQASAALAGNEVDAGRGSGSPGFDLRLVDGRIVVTSVRDGGAAQAAGIGAGWVLLRIGGTDLAHALRALRDAETELTPRMQRMHAWAAVTNRLSGPVGSTISFTLLDATDDTILVTVPRETEPGEMVRFLNLPPASAHLEHERLPAADGTTVGVIRFNIWMAPIAAEFSRAMDELRDADGIIVDLRGNIGGLGGMVMGTSGHFLDTTLTLGTLRTRSNELRFVSTPQRVSAAGVRVRPYRGPLVIIVDEVSASTSEFFAAAMQALGRARVVGDTTTGQALPAHTYPLPTGDVLMHAFADFRDPRGERIEGRGVIPDEWVPLDRGSLLRGRDAALERALETVVRLRAEAAAAPRAGGADNGR